MTMTTPSQVSSEIRNFCESIVPDTSPVYVDYIHVDGTIEDECFDNVELVVTNRGGRSLLGWTIWAWEEVLFEAEFHAVWEDENGNLHDPTPKADNETRILFLPNRVAGDNGGVTPSRHHPLQNWQEVADYIEICRQISDFQRQHYPNLPLLEWTPLVQRKERLSLSIRHRLAMETASSGLLNGLLVSEVESERRSDISTTDVEARTSHARHLASQGQFLAAFNVLLESARESRQIATELGETFRLLFDACNEPELVKATRREWSRWLH